MMETDIVHSIENPLAITNAALHVFAGNLFATPHLQWDAETLQEAPIDNGYMNAGVPEPGVRPTSAVVGRRRSAMPTSPASAGANPATARCSPSSAGTLAALYPPKPACRRS